MKQQQTIQISLKKKSQQDLNQLFQEKIKSSLDTKTCSMKFKKINFGFQFKTMNQIKKECQYHSKVLQQMRRVSWDYQKIENLDNQQNVKITNDYTNDIMYPYYEKCQGDNLCQKQVETYYDDDPHQMDLAYRKYFTHITYFMLFLKKYAMQYISFSNSQLYQ
ncbi:hypothetical protein ABPG72_001176 [Tetrahymena utriculariae]